jgi:hypothetical protein
MNRIMLLCVLAVFALFCDAGAHAQQCCTPTPTSESTSFTGANSVRPTASEFRQVLSTGTFSGWTVTEYPGALGSDGCWNPQVDPAYVPQYPTISGGTWPVAGDNSWQPDIVGWWPASVEYIRDNSPLRSNTPIIPYFPCGAQVNQQLAIHCPADLTEVFYNSVVQSETVYGTYVKNCRAGVCSVIYR